MSFRSTQHGYQWLATSVLAAAMMAGTLQAQAQTPVTIDCSPNSLAQLNTGQPNASNPAIDNRWQFQYLGAYAGSSPAN